MRSIESKVRDVPQERQEPTDVLIDGLTNLTMSRHPDRLRFMAEALIARSCFD
ncbi:MAG: hypothetical protein ABJQ34_05670 [Paracoccaceae bacterium]